MILENCCYDWFEMRTLNMAQHGVFGEILRAQGAYIHNLDDFWDYYWKNPDGSDPEQLGWRLKYNRENRGDVYATHGLGPVAQALDIHRGDRMTTLVAMDTKSVHGKELVEKKTGKPCNDFRNGDHTTTLIRTANHKVIELQHDVMNPQPYSRLYQLTGTKGLQTNILLKATLLTPASSRALATSHRLTTSLHTALCQKLKKLPSKSSTNTQSLPSLVSSPRKLEVTAVWTSSCALV